MSAAVTIAIALVVILGVMLVAGAFLSGMFLRQADKKKELPYRLVAYIPPAETIEESWKKEQRTKQQPRSRR